MLAFDNFNLARIQVWFSNRRARLRKHAPGQTSMGPPISSNSHYSHQHTSSLTNETYQMMNNFDFLNSTGHNQSSFAAGFQHNSFVNNQPQPFNSSHMHFNHNQGKLFLHFSYKIQINLKFSRIPIKNLD